MLRKIDATITRPRAPSDSRELAVVDPATELEFLHELPVALMWGVGAPTEARLATIGVTTIGHLAASSPQP